MPKPAYFAYRDALTPLMVNLRSDRWGYWVTEAISLEAWACNDLDTAPDGAELLAALEIDGQVIAAQRLPAQLPVSGSAFQGWLRFPAPAVAARTPARARLALRLPDGSMLHDTTLEITLFPPAPVTSGRAIRVVGAQSGPAAQLAGELGLTPQFTGPYAPEMPILIDDADAFLREQAAILAAVEHGATAVFLALPAGAYRLGPHQVTVTPCGMGARHFVSRATGHPLTADFLPEDFRLWHDPVAECITPLLDTTVDAPGWTTILASGNGGWESEWAPANAVMETAHGRGMLRVCALSLAQRTRTNPVACLFAERLLKGLRG